MNITTLIKNLSNYELFKIAVDIKDHKVEETMELLLLKNEYGGTITHWLCMFETYTNYTIYPPEVLVLYSSILRETVEDSLIRRGKILS